MPRVSRNIVQFVVDGLDVQAEFKHEHAEEYGFFVNLYQTKDILEPVDLIEEVTGGLLGSQQVTKRRMLLHRQERVLVGRDRAIKTPLTEPGDDGGIIKLRHRTTCILSTRANGTDWVKVGEGISRCSVKDCYRWRKGIKDSLLAAIKAAGIEREGPVLNGFYSELRKRPAPQPEADIVIA